MNAIYLCEKALAVELGLTDDQLQRFLAAHSKSPAMKVDHITGMRFWPAVKQYLLQYHGVSKIALLPSLEDGQENWN
jgi:hypothetical protein